MVSIEISRLYNLLESDIDFNTASPDIALGLVDDIKKAFKDAFNSVFSSRTSPVRKLYENLNDQLLDRLNSVRDGLSNAVNSSKKTVSDSIRNTSSWIVNAVNDSKSFISNSINKSSQFLSNSYNNTTTKLSNKLNDVKDGIIDGFNLITNKASQSVSNAIKNITKPISDIRYSLENRFDKAISSAKQNIDSFKNSVNGWINNASVKISNGYNGVKSAIENSIQKGINSAKDFAKETRTFFGESISKIQDFLKALKDIFLKAIEAIINRGKKELTDFISDNVLPNLEQSINFANGLQDLIKDLSSGELSNIDDFSNRFLGLFGGEDKHGILRSLLLAPAMYGALIQTQVLPYLRKLDASLRFSQQLDPANISSIVRARKLGKIDDERFFYEMQYNGLNSARASLELDSAESLSDPTRLMVALLRGKISEDDHDNYLRKAGYGDDTINLFKSIYSVLPPLQDIIRFAVREVFNEDISERFGQFEDYPEQFTGFAAQAGMSEYWAKAYWAAHWDLPSPQMGYQMLHRRIINEDDLKLLMKALDVMPFWRDKLIALSYNPLTRVDVRRMFRLGVLDEKAVTEAYLDLGYSPENAELMREFTVKYESANEEAEQQNIRELTRAMYLSAYSRNIIDRETYRNALLDMGYIEQDVELLLSIADYDIYNRDVPVRNTEYYERMNKIVRLGYQRGLYSREDAIELLTNSNFTESQAIIEIDFIDYDMAEYRKSKVLDYLKVIYVQRTIDNVELRTRLDTYGFTSTEIDVIESKLNLERTFRDRMPTLTDLRKFFENGIIGLDVFREQLKGLGFHDTYVDWYAQMYTGGLKQ